MIVSFRYSFLSLFSNSMARTKITPRKERAGKTVLRTSEERAWLASTARQGEDRRSRRRLARRASKEKIPGKQPPSPVHHPSPAKSSSPAREVEQTLEEMKERVEEASKLEEVGRSPSSSPTRQDGPNGCRSRAICFRRGACPKEVPPYRRGQGPTEGIPEGRKGPKDQEVPAWHSCPSRDPAVPKEY